MKKQRQLFGGEAVFSFSRAEYGGPSADLRFHGEGRTRNKGGSFAGEQKRMKREQVVQIDNFIYKMRYVNQRFIDFESANVYILRK